MKKVLPILLLVALSAGPFCRAAAETPPRESMTVAPEQLDDAISKVISRAEYTWRAPREKRAETEEAQGFLGSLLERLGKWIEGGMRKVLRIFKKFAEWLDKLLTPKDKTKLHPSGSVDWQSTIRALLFIFLVTAASILAIILFRMWKQRGRTTLTITARPVDPLAAIREEDVKADQLPSDEWMKFARQLLEQGEIRLAIRAMFLACLVHLAHAERVTIARHKSNREYIRELERKAHDHPDILEAFDENVQLLERVWYGMHTITDEMVASFAENRDLILKGQQA